MTEHGDMAGYRVAQAFVDARIKRIHAGTSEIVKETNGCDIAPGET